MKQRFKLLTLALGLLMGVTMTSCLGDGGEYQSSATAIAKVYSNFGMFYSFKTPGNAITISPTEASINSLESQNENFTMSSLVGKIVSIGYYWNSDDPNFVQTETSIEGVNLYAIQPLDFPTLVVPAENKGTARDSVATHPIISLNPTDAYGQKYQPYFFDNNKAEIIVPVNYYAPTDSRATSISITLVYYPDDLATVADKNEGILRLYLNYRVNGVEDYATQRSSFNFVAFSLHNMTPNTNIANQWGGSIDKVRIVAKVNSYSTDMDNVGTEEEVYDVVTIEELESK